MGPVHCRALDFDLLLLAVGHYAVVLPLLLSSS
jgi:hypothetical protein